MSSSMSRVRMGLIVSAVVAPLALGAGDEHSADAHKSCVRRGTEGRRLT